MVPSTVDDRTMAHPSQPANAERASIKVLLHEITRFEAKEEPNRNAIQLQPPSRLANSPLQCLDTQFDRSGYRSRGSPFAPTPDILEIPVRYGKTVG